MHALQWLVPAGTLLSRICRGYADVQLSRPDVERLARAASLGASWIPLLCSDSANETSETARALAKSYFDEPRWPVRRALNWIARRKVDALMLTNEELLGLRLQGTYKGSIGGLACKNPVHELLTALKADKVKAIGPDHKELPPEFWDGKSVAHWAWPEVRFRREDMLRLWPANGTRDTQAGAPLEDKAIKARRKRALSLAERLAGELTTMYPNGRPAMSVEEIWRELAERPCAGRFAKRTLEKALGLAWPEQSA